MAGQAPHRRPGKAPTAAGGAPLAGSLDALLQSQRQALESGDAASIEAATRLLAAGLLHEMSKLRLIEGQVQEAISLDRKSLQMNDSADTRLEVASTLLRTGSPKEALDEVSTLIEADPGNAIAYTVRGSALRSLGNEKDAAEALGRSLAIKPDVNVAYALGASLLAIHEKAKAARIFEQIIRASGDAAIWHVAAGDAYREANYLQEAVDEFKKAIAIDPRVGHAEFFLGFTYLQMNEWGPSSQSFEHLRTAVRLAPHEYVSNFYLGAIESTDGSDIASSNRHLHVAAGANPTAPEVWLYLGLNAVRQKDTPNAKIYLRKAIALTGDDEARNNYQIRRVYAVLGRILVSEGDREEGEALLAKYKNSEHRSIGNSAKFISETANHLDAPNVRGDLPVAKVSLPGVSAGAPEDSDKPESRGAGVRPVPQHTATEKKQIADSEKQLSQLLASCFNDLGTAEARQGKYSDALPHFQEAEHWEKPTPVLLHNIGVAAFRVEDFRESARALSLYLDGDGNEVAAQSERSRLMLAMSLFSLGQFKEADQAFARIAAITLKDSRAAYSWAYSLAHSGQQQHANEIASQLIEQEMPSDVRSLVCHVYMDTENYEQSVGCYRKALLLDSGLRMAHYQVGESLIRLNRPAEAVGELRQELAMAPDHPDVQYSLALALLQSNHKTEAMDLLHSLIEAHPTHAQAQYQVGKVLLEEGNAAGAVEHLKVAVENDPGPDYVHYQLQAAYRKAGRVEDADKELEVYRGIKARKRESASGGQGSQPPH